MFLKANKLNYDMENYQERVNQDILVGILNVCDYVHKVIIYMNDCSYLRKIFLCLVTKSWVALKNGIWFFSDGNYCWSVMTIPKFAEKGMSFFFCGGRVVCPPKIRRNLYCVIPHFDGLVKTLGGGGVFPHWTTIKSTCAHTEMIVTTGRWLND